MWRCNVTSNTGYTGFTRVYNGILTSLVFRSRKPEKCSNFYVEMIKNNKIIFLDCIRNEEAGKREELTEPRDLLILLNYLDGLPFMYFAPRPYMRMGRLSDDFVYLFPGGDKNRKERILACLVCGVENRMPDFIMSRKGISVIDTYPEYETLSDQTRWRMMVGAYETGSKKFIYKTKEMLEYMQSGREPHYVHHKRCPLEWLSRDDTCSWNTKKTILYVDEPSIFKNVMRVLENGLNSEAEWIEFILVTSRSGFHNGCCEQTLVYLYHSILEYKLQTTPYDGILNFPIDNLLRVVRNNETRGNVYTEARSAGHMLITGTTTNELQILREDDRGVLDREQDPMVFNNSLSASTPLNLSLDEEDTLIQEYVNVSYNRTLPTLREQIYHNREWNDCQETVIIEKDDTSLEMCLKRLKVMHGYVVGFKNHLMCIYCAAVYDDTLMPWSFCKDYYTEEQCTDILHYSIQSKSRSLTKAYKRGPTKSLSYHLLPFTITDVTSNLRITKITDRYRVHLDRDVPTANKTNLKSDMDDRLHRICIWLSATMDFGHVNDCLFKFKRYSYMMNACVKCGSTGNHHYFSCGHSLCIKCYSDIRITDCIVCNRGVRLRNIVI